MVISTSIKTYLAIFLIGIFVVIAGVSLYGLNQQDTTQTPTTIYKGLTETEEEIVKENIKAKVEAQKMIQTEKVDKEQPSYVDNTQGYDNNEDYDYKTIHEAPVPIITRADVPDSVTSEKKSKNNSTQANSDKLDELISKFDPKDVKKGNFKSVEIISDDDLKKVLTDLKVSGKFSDKNIIQIKKSVSVGDGVSVGDAQWIDVEIEDK